MRTTWKHSKRDQKKNPTQGSGSSNESFGIDFRISNGRLKAKDEERIDIVTSGPEDQKGRKMGKTKGTRKHLLEIMISLTSGYLMTESLLGI
jgi:hypothetical protein